MTLRFTKAAEVDVENVISWYRERGNDLADQFLLALDQCLNSLQENPLAFAVVHGDIRRALLRRFPYCIFYIKSQKDIVVLACLHGHRDPQEWQKRRDA
jgi:plasmid stabilization system protein ParE